MVALKKYARIEASGLWRPAGETQRREVVVVLGDATLTIKSFAEQPLAHWSLAAIDRANPGEAPARYHPNGDPEETLELDARDTEMVDALETLRRAVDRARPRPGRLRWLGAIVSAAAVAALAVFWAPGALREHTLAVVPDAARQEIGQALLTRIQRVTGPACGTSANTSGLARFGQRLGVPTLAVMRGGFDTTLHLPGGRILLARQVLEDHEAPDTAAGFVLAEQVRATQHDPMRRLLDQAGTFATFRLLTTGTLPAEALDAHAEALLTRTPATLETEDLLAAFEAANVPSTPYAYARDITGETVLKLIEADPFRGAQPPPVLSDADWLRLQSICGG